MRFVARLLLAGAVLTTSVVGVAVAGSKCNCHMCPAAQAANTAGLQVVKELPLANVSVSELES